MAIEDRNLKVGTKMVAKYKGQEHTAEVIEGEGGKAVFWMNGKTYKSPSAAGSAVMGGTACNGWRFWSVKGGGEPAQRATARSSNTRNRRPPEEKAKAETTADEKRSLLTKAMTDPEATPETRVVAAEALEDLGHIDCSCSLSDPAEAGICNHEIEGDCTPA